MCLVNVLIIKGQNVHFYKADPVDIFIRESDFLKRRFCPQDKNLINSVLQNKAAQLWQMLHQGHLLWNIVCVCGNWLM